MKYHQMVLFKSTRSLVHILLGLFIGFFITLQFRTINYESFKKGLLHQFCFGRDLQQAESFVSKVSYSDLTSALLAVSNVTRGFGRQRRLVLVAVMTAKPFLDSRARTIYHTWGKDLNGDILFFSSANSSAKDLPLISLPGVDDAYPPQKKSFLMFKFIHDFFGDKYKYFMRADDDVFVNVAKLRSFLQNLNSSAPLFIGQTGVGNQEEFGQLSLDLYENFCMGGPGIIMSHPTLSKLANNVPNCLKNLYSTHEDVEIGRCVRRFAGTSCTWSYDMQNLLYHNQSIQSLIQNDVYPSKELRNALTIHPIKLPSIMIKLYLYHQNVMHQQLRLEVTQIYRMLKNYVDERFVRNISDNPDGLIATINQLGFSIAFNQLFKFSDSSLTWKFFSKKLYQELSINPKRNIERHIVQSFNDNMQRIVAHINRNSLRKGRFFDYHSLYYGYAKFDPQTGIQHILDFLMIYRKYQGKRLTIPMRRRVYAIQTFYETQIRELDSSEADQTVINIIVPLTGRVVTFKRFIRNFLDVYHEDSRITLSVVVFPQSDTSENIAEIHRTLTDLKHVSVNLLQLNGTFSRGVALQESSTLFDDHSLLFFLDVDMRFSVEVLFRIRRNTKLNRQVYFPIVFSQYSNQVRYLLQENHRRDNSAIGQDEGYWRQFGFGIVSLYKNDLLAVGGYNLTIHGWGMEDVNLYDRVVASNLTIFRAIDPDLIHIYHDIHCDRHLSSIQFEMCLGTKLSSLDSVQQLANFSNQHRLIST